MAETPENATEPAPPQTSGSLGRLREAFGRLSNQQKMLMAVGLAAITAILVGAFLWSRQPDYKVLFANVSDRDGAAIIAALEQSGVPYQLAGNGGTVLVPSERVHDVRLRLAGQGLPRGGSVGFEVMENQKFGISQFAEQVNYQRALEGELARSIESISIVDSARVHLAIPKPSVFVREEQKPTASVLLHLVPGRSLEPSQVAGISHLIASSVPQLPLSNVTITDQNGNLISQLKDKLQEAGLDAGQLKYVREIEGGIIKRISDMLVPVVGEGNFRVQVAADLDFSRTERTSEVYGPESVTRSEQISETTNFDRPPPGGVPGSLTNQPPVPAIAPITQPPVGAPADGAQAPPPNQSAFPNPGRISVGGVQAELRDPVTPPMGTRKDVTTNNEITRTISHIQEVPGNVRRLTAAVVINYRLKLDEKSGKELPTPLNETEITQITNLAREAMGYSAQRGDSISVANAPFTLAAATEASLPFWKNADYVAPGLDIAKYLVLAGLVFLLYWVMVRPVVRSMFPEAPKAGSEESEQEHDAFADSTKESAESDPFAQQLQAARDFAQSNPKAVAHIITDWLNPG